ncbi:hypothetical protein [Pseudomonas yamanorum]|uniref:hypothetical protein n=1 Tax=Pseudomonas yamanorum TaxID=515393 RepID=UPI002ED46FD2|nr:hypothetical protein VYI69_13485 [Pseudomonas yamanorum]
MRVTLNLTSHLSDTLRDFRRLHAEYERTTSSPPELELNKLYSALSTSALILAEALNESAQQQGL